MGCGCREVTRHLSDGKSRDAKQDITGDDMMTTEVAETGLAERAAVLSGQFYVAEMAHAEHGLRAPVGCVTCIDPVRH